MRLAIAALALLAAMPAAADPTYTLLRNPRGGALSATAVNQSGAVAGIYVSTKHRCGLGCGFLRHPDGRLEIFHFHSAFNISVDGINAQDAIVGEYFDDDHIAHGFLRTADGAITKLRVKGHPVSATAINDSGMITGVFRPDAFYRSYLRMPDGTTTTLKIEGRSDLLAFHINASGMIGANFFKNESRARGALRAPDGTFTVFSAPDDEQGGTTVLAIDDEGDAAGEFTGADGLDHDYIRDADGTMRVFDVPGIGQSGLAEPACIALVGAERQVIGYALTSDQHYFGYVRHGDGTIETFDLSQGHSFGDGTTVRGCNRAGTAVGYYTVNHGPPHSFLRTP